MEEDWTNLIKLFKMFKNRPYHLAKYLINNSALKKDFINKLKNSKNISEFDEKEDINFITIEQMENFYLSLIDIKKTETKSNIEIEKELNKKLDELIKSESYEEASKIRDYMQIKGLKRITKFK
jgi:hypothetical protein